MTAPKTSPALTTAPKASPALTTMYSTHTQTTAALAASFIVSRAMETKAGIRKMSGGAFQAAVKEVTSRARCTESEAIESVRRVESDVWQHAQESHSGHGKVQSYALSIGRAGCDSRQTRREELTEAQWVAVESDIAERKVRSGKAKLARAAQAALASEEQSNAIRRAFDAGKAAGMLAA